jgi:hypothetical protein
LPMDSREQLFPIQMARYERRLVRRSKDKLPMQQVERWRARERKEHEDKKQAEENAERRALLEDIIDRGLQTFIEVGSALKEIKERKLWKPEYASFEDYCYQRWNWTARYANNVTRAARTALILGPPFPANEAIARELAKVVEEDPETGQAAWATFTADNPNPTAKETRAFLRNFLREEPTKRPAPPRPLATDATKKTFQYIESTLSELDPKQQKAYLMALQHYAREAYYIGMGAWRPRKGQKIGGFINWNEAAETWYRPSDRDADDPVEDDS